MEDILNDYGHNMIVCYSERSTVLWVMMTVKNTGTSDIQGGENNNVKLSATVDPPVV